MSASGTDEGGGTSDAEDPQEMRTEALVLRYGALAQADAMQRTRMLDRARALEERATFLEAQAATRKPPTG